MKRLFTFGCSFTQYTWPTWADILGREFDHFENWGHCGGGNQFIFNSIVECLVKNKLSQNDQIIIMWTNIAREDRYANNKWSHTGNIFQSGKSTIGNFHTKFLSDIKGYLIRDLAIIHATKKLLEQYNIPYIFTCMVPIDNSEQYCISPIEGIDNILSAYQEDINCIRTSVYESIFNFDWGSRPLFADIDKTKQLYTSIAGTSWPKFEEYLQKKFNNIEPSILSEIKRFDTTFNIHMRHDKHPTPAEHLEYIDIIMPEFNISADSRAWVADINNKLVLKQNYNNLWNQSDHIPTRW